MHLRPIASYARELKSVLPSDAFAPATTRLAWLPIHLSIITLATVTIARGWLPFYVTPLLSLVLGMSFAGLTFLAHETMHGSVVRQRHLRFLVGWIGFLPFVISPRLWVAWHNRVHHGHANEPGIDPDANPTLEEYLASRKVRVVTDHFAIGRTKLTGLIGLLVGLSIQSATVLYFAGRRGYLPRRQHRWAQLETALGVSFWLVVLAIVGPLAFLFSFGIPLIIANVIVMSFIFTNHGLSPVTRTNDPLANSLSVTTPALVEWVTLGFGHHVEHHLFPAMSSRRAPMLRGLLLERWPERYQSMSLWRALVTMHRTGRVYGTDTTLSDPRARREWPTLLPREVN